MLDLQGFFRLICSLWFVCLSDLPVTWPGSITGFSFEVSFLFMFSVVSIKLSSVCYMNLTCRSKRSVSFRRPVIRYCLWETYTQQQKSTLSRQCDHWTLSVWKLLTSACNCPTGLEKPAAKSVCKLLPVHHEVESFTAPCLGFSSSFLCRPDNFLFSWIDMEWSIHRSSLCTDPAE